MKLVLIRHGQTQWNVQKRIQGWLDSPLTDCAKQQLERMNMPTLNQPLLFSSDLGRAYQSALIIGRGMNVEVQIDTRLRERGFGVLQGEVIDEKPSLSAYWAAYQSRYQQPLSAVPEVESEGQFEQRLCAFLEQVVTLDDTSDIVLVTHGEWIRACVNVVNGVTSWHSGFGIEANAKPMVLDLMKNELALG